MARTDRRRAAQAAGSLCRHHRWALALLPALALLSGAVHCRAQDSWVRQASNSDSPLAGVTYGGGLFVACGDGGALAVSADGVGWSPASSGTSAALRSIAFGNGRFVAVGQNGDCTSSADGSTWTAGNTGIPSFASGVAFGDGVFVAVGSGGRVSRSTDGGSWTAAPSGASTAFLQNVSFGGGVFVAVGASGLILRSGDGGITWNPVASGTTRHLQGISSGGGMFVAAGQNAAVLVSADLGLTWTRILHGLTTDWMQSVTSGAGQFVVAGTNGAIISAPASDLTSWALQDSTVGAQLGGAGFGAGKFVAVGELIANRATIVTSDAPPPQPLTFSAWQARHFSPAQLLLPTTSGAGADPDCDGAPNFLEYALGSDPLVADAGSQGAPRVGISIDPDQGRHLAVTFQRPLEVRAAVIYRLRKSPDLASWAPVAASSEEILADDGVVQLVRLTDLAPLPPGGRAFVELQALAAE